MRGPHDANPHARVSHMQSLELAFLDAEKLSVFEKGDL
jgi:hypothetical protein